MGFDSHFEPDVFNTSKSAVKLGVHCAKILLAAIIALQIFGNSHLKLSAKVIQFLNYENLETLKDYLSTDDTKY